MKKIDVEAIKACHLFPEFFIQRGIHLHPAGNLFKGKCPLHQEQRGESFVVDPTAQTWSCFGKCDLHRKDVIEFVKLARGVEFVEACELLGGDSSNYQCTGFKCPSRRIIAPSPTALPPLTSEQNEIIRRARWRLYQDARLCSRIAEKRGWKPETVRSLSVEWGLGWVDQIRLYSAARQAWYWVRNAIAYCYPNGLKLRYKPKGAAEKRHVWAFGGPTTCWRSQLRNFHRCPDCILTEGEPDAITAINDGLDVWGECAVVALPSASTIPSGIEKLFAGKRVYLAMDQDEAGRRARDKVSALLDGVARNILELTW